MSGKLLTSSNIPTYLTSRRCYLFHQGGNILNNNNKKVPNVFAGYNYLNLF